MRFSLHVRQFTAPLLQPHDGGCLPCGTAALALGDGHDALYGSAGNDMLSGGPAWISCMAASVTTRSTAMTAPTRCMAMQERTRFAAGAGGDTLFGRDGNDMVRSGNDDDRIFGNQGADHSSATRATTASTATRCGAAR